MNGCTPPAHIVKLMRAAAGAKARQAAPVVSRETDGSWRVANTRIGIVYCPADEGRNLPRLASELGRLPNVATTIKAINPDGSWSHGAITVPACPTPPRVVPTLSESVRNEEGVTIHAMYALTGNTVAALLPVIDHEKRNAVLSGIGLVKEYDDQGLALGTDGKAAAIMRIRAERGNVWNIILSSDMAEALAQLPDAEWTIYGGLKKQAKEEEEGRLRLVQACARLPDGATVSVIGRRIDGTYPTFEQARRKETGQTLILPDAELVADLAKTVRKAHGHLLRVGLKGVDATAGNGSVVVAGVVPGMSGPIDGTTLDPVKLRQIAEVLRLAGIKGQTEWTRSGVGRGWTFHADGFEAILMPVYTETGLAEPGDVPDIPIVQAQAAAAPKARKVTASGKHNAQLEKLRAILRECKTEDGALAMQNHEAAVRRLRHINSLIESVTTE